MTDIVKEYLLSQPNYVTIIEQLGALGRGVFPFNPVGVPEQVQDVFLYDTPSFPMLLKRVVCELVAEWKNDDKAKNLMNHLSIQITNSNKIKLNEWSSAYEGIPVEVECQVIAAYKKETYTKYAEAKCHGCGRTEEARSLSRLPLCGNKDCEYYKKEMWIDEKKTKTGDIKTILIEEPIEESKSSSPEILECQIRDQDVSNTFTGNKKRIIGILRSQPQKNKSTNKILIHALSVSDLEDTKAVLPNPEQETKFISMSKKEDYLDILSSSWAPEIKFEDLAKICMILAVVGGVKVDTLKGIINTFLVGDPGTGKSKILEFLLKVVQRSALAVGGTMSGSGVTVTMDTLPNRTKLPRAGIVPLCHGSAVALDELSQLEEEDIGKLYEAMASGLIHYNKGGFDEVFKAETTITAGANPKGYNYDSSLGMLANIGLPEPLITRFDLIVNMMGSKSLPQRETIRDHIKFIRRFGISEVIKKNGLLTSDELMVLLNHAKTFYPVFTDEAEKIIDDFHTTMEELQATNQQEQGAKRADNRTFEALYRIATAVAKLYFSNLVSAHHAEIAVDIYKRTLHSFGLKTDKGITQLNMNDAVKDKHTAAVFTWRKVEQESGSTLIDGVVFIKRLMLDHPTYYPTIEEADKWFENQRKKGKIIMKGMQYKYVD